MPWPKHVGMVAENSLIQVYVRDVICHILFTVHHLFIGNGNCRVVQLVDAQLMTFADVHFWLIPSNLDPKLGLRAVICCFGMAKQGSLELSFKYIHRFSMAGSMVVWIGKLRRDKSIIILSNTCNSLSIPATLVPFLFF